MRPCCALFGLLVTAAALAGCSGGGSTSSASARAAVASGIVASGGGVGLDQAQTFLCEVQGNWAIAYDPASPPGCSPGGLWGAPDGPPIAENPCDAYLLLRRKNRWALLSSGRPGTFIPPEDAPKRLGDPGGLIYLGQS